VFYQLKKGIAQGFGGRVQKNESLDAASLRSTEEVLVFALERGSDDFVVVYEHFYQDSIFGEDVSTHYVVLAYRLILKESDIRLSAVQHKDTQWLSANVILADPSVQHYTKLYFDGL